MSQQINLFNPVFLKQKKIFSVLTMLQALALILLGSGLFYGYAVYQVQQLAKQSADADKRYAVEQVKLVNYANEFSPQKSSQIISDELKNLEAQAASQNELLDTIKSGVIGNTEGYSEYMRAFARQTVNGLWLTAFDIVGDGAQLSLSGAVLSPQLVPTYIQRLGKEKALRGKTFATLQIRQPKRDGTAVASHSYVEFNLQSVEAGGAAK